MVVEGGWINSVVGETVHGGGPGTVMVVVSYINSYVSPVRARKHAQCHYGYELRFGEIIFSIELSIRLSCTSSVTGGDDFSPAMYLLISWIAC